MTNGYPPQGWYADPTYPGGARYWNGVSWAEAVSRGGVILDATIDPAQAALPPAPGTQVGAPPPTVEYTLPSDDSKNRSLLGVVVGVLVALFAVPPVVALISNDGSSDESPPGTDGPPATEAPATDAPTTEAPAEGG